MRQKILPLLDQIVVSGGNFLTILLCAKLLTLGDQGSLIVSFSLYMALLLFSIALVYSGIPILYKKMSDPKKYFYSATLFHTAITLLFLTLLAIIYKPLVWYFDYNITYQTFGICLLFIFFQQYADFARRTAYVISSHTIAFFYSFVTYVPRIIALYVIQPHTLSEVFIILSATATVPFFFIFVQTIYLIRQEKLNIDLEMLKQHLTFSKNIIQTVPIGWSMAYLPIFAIGVFSGSAAVAIIGTFKTITNAANVFVEVIEVTYITQWHDIFQHKGEQALKKKIMETTFNFTIFWIFGIVAIYVGYDHLIEILGNSYEGYLSILLILWGSYLAYFYGRMYVLYHRILSNTQIERDYAILGFIVTIASMYIIYRFGLIGAAMSFLMISTVPILLFIIPHQLKFKGNNKHD